MLKVFATQVVVSRGYDGAAAIKFSEKGDAVRFRIGKKVYDPTTTLRKESYYGQYLSSILAAGADVSVGIR